jgi:hypothetical protein
LNEAAKLGFSRCIVPATHRTLHEVPAGMDVIPARSLADALAAAMGQSSAGAATAENVERAQRRHVDI